MTEKLVDVGRSKSNPNIPVLYRTLSTNTQFNLEGIRHEPSYAVLNELQQSTDHLCRLLGTNKARGLTSAQAKELQRVHGPNVVNPPKVHYFQKFMSYVFGGFNFLMWIAAILVFISWQPLSGDQASVFQLGVALMLLCVIAISTFFYALVDYNASRAMQSIQTLMPNRALVIRDGEFQEIEVETLVPGDLVCVKAGQRVAADLRLIDVSSDARFDRSVLTGESKPIAASVEATSMNPLETKNMGLSSTFLVRGTARGIVIKTGNDTVIGNILKLSIASSKKTTKSPIQNDIAFFTIVISIVAVFFFTFALAFWGGFIQSRFPEYETAAVAIINSIGCLIAFVPQGLPICFALALTVIARRMAKQHVLVKNLNMVETLGCISVLCSDKTGTLTEGRMAVDTVMFIDAYSPVSYQQIKAPSDISRMAVSRLLQIAHICNDATFEMNTDHIPVYERPVLGDATDAAIFIYAENMRPLFPDMPRFQVNFSLAFNSKNKFMAKVIRTDSGRTTLLVKGAPDILLSASSFVMLANGSIAEIDDERGRALTQCKNQASRQGHRVIAHCEKPLTTEFIPTSQDALEVFVNTEVKRGLTLIGLLALRDPPRKEVPDAIRRMRHAGIRVFMVTGDFELTACAIANRVGIVTVPENEIKHVSDLASTKKSSPLPDDVKPFELRPQPGAPHRAIVINGIEVEALTQSDWDCIATRFDEMVFARTTPEHKVLIVENLKERGDNVVAVTGDGTNDAPALKVANVGVSMGSGTDIAKEAASMILLSNAFSSLLVGIENGRLVFENLKKVLLYLMPAGTYAEFVAVASSAFFGMPIPLSAFQQVLFCVANDLIMSVSLMYEKPEADLMDRPPRNPRTDKLTDWKFFVQIYLIIGPIIWISCMGMWFLYMSTEGIGFYDLMFAFDRFRVNWRGKPHRSFADAVSTGQCIYFVTMAICQIGTLLAVRNRTTSTLQSNPLWGPRQNLLIFFSIACNIAICLIIFYGYWIQIIFSTTPIPVNYWFIPFGFLLSIVLVDEIRKYIVKKFPRSPVAKIAW